LLLDQELPISIYLGKNSLAASKEEGIVGIEFENEFLDIPDKYRDDGFPNYVYGSVWRFHSENSLRHHGFEYVSKPINITKVKQSNKGLFDRLRADCGVTKLKCTNSIRTSVHVHFDVLQLNTLEITNFATLYWILEPFLQHFCGKHRQGNLFCIRLKDSLWMRNNLSLMLRGGNKITGIQLVGSDYRYSSVNFNSLHKFGTLEFRIMRGVSHERPANIWVDALDAIRRFSLKFKNPLELKNWYLKEVDAKNLPEVVLGEDLFSTLKTYLPEDASVENLVRDGYLSVVEILSAHDDYSEERKEREQKELEEIKARYKSPPTINFTNDDGYTVNSFNTIQWVQPEALPPNSDAVFIDSDFIDEEVEDNEEVPFLDYTGVPT
jgi:hypothetical protein